MVDDEEAVRQGVRMVLEYAGMVVGEAGSGERALEVLAKEPFDVVLLDLKLPGLDGMGVLERLVSKEPCPQVVMISAHGDVPTAVQATRLGAFDFLEKPLDQDRLLVTIRNAAHHGQLLRETQLLRTSWPSLDHILGVSPAIQEVRRAVAVVAQTDARVLITGESGTGKELVARAIHAGSSRAGEPFVEVNCAALPSELIESELFGHEKGAFTGAVARRQGKFELAHRGTLFLDEVGDMSPAAQAKVLRVLEEGKVYRVGGTSPVSVDVRVIAATNKPLGQRVEAGTFREDLYYRLNVVPIRVPPLRERREDIPLLAAHFLDSFSMKMGKPHLQLSEGAIEILEAHPWPGNVRQLKNVMERVALFCQGSVVTPLDVTRHLDPEGQGAPQLPMDVPFDRFLCHVEREYLLWHLRKNGWNVTRTAQEIGMQRSNLYKKMERLQLKRGEGVQ